MSHAKIPPSSLHRIMQCPASVKASQYEPDISSPEAKEGSAAHELAEKVLMSGEDAATVAELYFGDYIEYEDEKFRITQETIDAVDEYAQFCRNLPKFEYAIEMKVQIMGEDCWGTSDFFAWNDTELFVVDFKYGQGVKVDAKENPQLMAYALGALNFIQKGPDTANGPQDIKDIHLSIVQPRKNNTQTHTIQIKDLYDFQLELADTLAKVAVGTKFKPSGGACRWCPARENCEPMAKYAMETALGGFDNLGDVAKVLSGESKPAKDLLKKTVREGIVELSPAELGRRWRLIELVKVWIQTVENRAEARLLGGLEVPGLRLGQKMTRRIWESPESAVKALRKCGLKVDEHSPRTLISPAKAEEKVGKHNPKLTAVIVKPEGGPRVVKEESNAKNYVLEATSGFELTDVDDVLGDF